MGDRATKVPTILLGLTGLSLDGGISSVSRSIVRSLDESQAKGEVEAVHRVLFLDGEADVKDAPEGSSQSFSRGSRIYFAAQIWKAILRFRPDVVLFDHVGLARVMFSRLPIPRPRISIFVHGLEIRDAERDSRRYALRSASQILANSDHTHADLTERMPDLADRVRTIPLCIEPDRIEEWMARSAAGAGAASHVPSVLIVGRMWRDQPGKGHDALIRGWPQVRERVADAELWIVGTGNDQPRLEELARECGVSESVRFKGRVSDEELAWCYSNASVFAMPSAQEGFGLVYLEAMWHGLPCVVSDADAGQTVVSEESGVVVEYGNADATAQAVVSLLADPGRVETMGAAASRRVSREFSYESFSKRLRAALEIGPVEGEGEI